jgi:hypothetical protein
MGALQGMGTPAAFSAQTTPWGQPWGHFAHASYPYAQSFNPQLPGVSFGYQGATSPFGIHAQQQLLQSLQAAVQQALQVVPQQLQQIQQLVLLLAQQSYQPQQVQGQQPFQIPSFAPPAWLGSAQAGQQQLFGGAGGYVM